MLNKKNCKKYIIHNIFVTNPKQYVITGKKKNNFNGKFKLEPVKTYYVGFVVKVLQNLVNIALLKNCPNKQISLKSQTKCLIVIF